MGNVNMYSVHDDEWEALLVHACMGALNEPVSSDWDDPPACAPCKLWTSCSPDQQVAVLLAQGGAVAATHDGHQLLYAGFHHIRV